MHNVSLDSSHISVSSAWPLELVPRLSRLLHPAFPFDAPSPPEVRGGGGEGVGEGEGRRGVSSPSGTTTATIATTYLGGHAASQSEDQYEHGGGNVFGQRISITKMAHARRSKIPSSTK